MKQHGQLQACSEWLAAGPGGAMSYVIDRRLNGKNKSTVNRQRFLRRYQAHIKKAVEEAVGRRSITDIEHGEQISIPARDIDEPIFHHGPGGARPGSFPATGTSPAATAFPGRKGVAEEPVAAAKQATPVKERMILSSR